MQKLIEEDLQITLIHGISGSTAAVLSTCLLYPFENIKTRMQIIQRTPRKRGHIRRVPSIDYNNSGTIKENEGKHQEMLPKSSPTFKRKNSNSKTNVHDNIHDFSIKEIQNKLLSPNKLKSPTKSSPLKKTASPLKHKKHTLPTISSKFAKPIDPLLTLKEVHNNKNIRHYKRAHSDLLMRRFSLKQNSENTKNPYTSPKKINKRSTIPLISPIVESSPKTVDTIESAENEERTDNESSNNMLDEFVKVCHKEGFLGLYKGITPLLMGNFISYGVYFFWYEAFKKYMKVKTNDILGYSKIAFFSGIITSTVTNPFWIINAKMTIQKGNTTFWQTLMKIIETEGFAGLFKGIITSLTLVVNPILQFSIYEFLKNKLRRSKNQFLVYFFGGAISKAIATILTYPYQVIRTNIHIRKQKASFYEIFQEIYQNSGWMGFFKGLSPKLSQTVLNSAFLLLIYEKIFYLFFMLLFKHHTAKFV